METVSYFCKCGWENKWTLDEIVQLNEEVYFRSTGGGGTEYSLPCQRPDWPCPNRYVVRVEQEKKP